MNQVALELREATVVLGPFCNTCSWWQNCITQLTEDQRKVQYASCFERDEPFFIFAL